MHKMCVEFLSLSLGVPDSSDNCPVTPNVDQLDSDGDAVGDVCDNCHLVSPGVQTDTDQNGVGDACDAIGGTSKDTYVSR